MADILKGNLGAEASYDVAFTAGSLVVSVKYQGAQASVQLSGSVSSSALIAELEKHVSNPVEKAALETLAALISKIP